MDCGQQIEAYCDLLLRWNQTYRLIGASSRDDMTRHVADALSLLPYLPRDRTVVDIGSGNGIPGLIIAIATQSATILIESNQKKAAFLTIAKHHLSLPVQVLAQRVESVDLSLYQPSVILSRAFGSVKTILDMSCGVSCETNRIYLLHKSAKQLTREVDEALRRWDFQYEQIPSGLRIEHVTRRA